ncbi:hypothetical protein PHLCEN_2v52 [Hermanssonia centrifuga]|uniref:BTB domain-containing protein n=1 Tax=Hermanssonia centrifuga TaxID=98765 RepID=A0A2R6S753_9APHY|nr:hypothetical protein PHLCEN_2v52 [Hermanssonia centrifuga]
MLPAAEHATQDVDHTNVESSDIDHLESSVAHHKPQSNTFWFDEAADCIVIAVQGTRFRLLRAKLCKNSKYFTRLFGSASDDADRCYDIDGVSSDDFKALINAMDDAILYVLEPPPSPVVASILRAAHKLECENILRFSKQLLCEIWSPDLHRLSTAPIPSALPTILLARDLDISQVLKRAFYELLRNSEPREGLSEEDQRRVNTAHGELQMHWAGFLWTTPNSHAFRCHTPSSVQHPPIETTDVDKRNETAKSMETEKEMVCTAQLERDHFQAWRDLLEEHGLFAVDDPLGALQSLAAINWEKMGYCAGCVEGRCEAFIRKRDELWNRLDGWFDL